MKKYAFFAALMIMLACAPFATITYVGSIDGTGSDRQQNNFTSPSGLGFYDGKLYVADSFSKFVYATLNNTVVSRSGGNGVLTEPLGITIDTDGKRYVADRGAAKVFFSNGDSDYLSLGTISFGYPISLAIDGQTLYLLDANGPSIVSMSKTDAAGRQAFVFNAAGDKQLSNPTDFAFYQGQFYIADSGNNRVAVFDRNFTFVANIGKGKGGVQLSNPRAVCVSNNILYVAEASSGRLVAFSLDGYPLETLSTSGNASLITPSRILANDGKLYVSDQGKRKVQVYSIDSIGGNSTVLAEIQSANSSVNALAPLISVAGTLGVPFSSSAQAYLSNAVSSYGNFRYSDASDQARAAASAAQSDSAALRQTLTIRLRTISSDASSTIAQYPASSLSSDLSQERGAIASKITQLDSLVTASNFNDAASTAISLKQMADSFKSKAAGNVQQVQTTKQRQDALNATATSLASSLSQLLLSASSANKTVSSSDIESLLSSARTSIASGSLDEANASLLLASAKISALSNSLNSQFPTSDSSAETVANVSAQIVKIEGEKLLFYPNMQPARTLLLQAQEVLATDPQKAVSLSNDALVAARREASNARTLSYIAIAIAGIAFIALLASAGVIWYLLSKKKHKGI